jgi:hypothetical protein
MSQAIRTAKMNIHPSFYENKKGEKVFQTDIFNPQTVALEVSPDSKQAPDQIKAILENCFENGIEAEIDFSPTKDRWGNEKFIIYDVKPLPKKIG